MPSSRSDAGKNQAFANHCYACVLVGRELLFPHDAVFDSVENIGVVVRSIEIIACTWAVGRLEVLKSFRSYWKVREEKKLLLHIFLSKRAVLSPRPRRTKPAVRSLRSRAKRIK